MLYVGRGRSEETLRSAREIDLYKPPTGWWNPNEEEVPEGVGDGDIEGDNRIEERARLRLPSMSYLKVSTKPFCI